MSLVLCPHDSSTGECVCRSLGLGKLSLWTAAEFGLVDAVEDQLRKLSSSSFAPTAAKCDSFGYTALHYAAQRNHVSVVRLLLRLYQQQGIRVSVDHNACGCTPLHRAAAFNSLEACRMLIDAGADVNAVDVSFADLRTPLMKASERGHVDVVRLLLLSSSAAVDESLVDRLGLSAWDLASAHPAVRQLLKPQQPHQQQQQQHETTSLAVDNKPCTPPPPPSSTTTGFVQCALCHQPSLFLQRRTSSSSSDHHVLLVCAACAARSI